MAKAAAVRDSNDFTVRNAAFGMRNYTRAAAMDTFENFIGSIYFSDAKNSGAASLRIPYEVPFYFRDEFVRFAGGPRDSNAVADL